MKKELDASIRNRMQAIITTLEALKQGKSPSQKLIEKAWKDFKALERLVEKL